MSITIITVIIIIIIIIIMIIIIIIIIMIDFHKAPIHCYSKRFTKRK